MQVGVLKGKNITNGMMHFTGYQPRRGANEDTLHNRNRSHDPGLLLGLIHLNLGNQPPTTRRDVMRFKDLKLTGSRIVEKQLTGTESGGQPHYNWKQIAEFASPNIARVFFEALADKMEMRR
jgi:hypothetical protein